MKKLSVFTLSLFLVGCSSLDGTACDSPEGIGLLKSILSDNLGKEWKSKIEHSLESDCRSDALGDSSGACLIAGGLVESVSSLGGNGCQILKGNASSWGDYEDPKCVKEKQALRRNFLEKINSLAEGMGIEIFSIRSNQKIEQKQYCSAEYSVHFEAAKKSFKGGQMEYSLQKTTDGELYAVIEKFDNARISD